jgi:DNA-binding Lrp family transcriptional regulator
MEKLDLKDRKILYYLDLNSRQSFAQLGKKVGLHKDAVALRVKKLQENGIIYSFYTSIDFSKLGYNVYRYYFLYQYITPEKREEIIDYLVKNKYSLWITSLEGQYDLSVYMAVKDINDFYHIWDDAFRKYNKYFSKRSFSVYCSEKIYGYTFLLDEKLKESPDLDKTVEYGGRTSVKVDNLDIELLKLLSANARMPLIKLAEELKCSTQTIHNRIRNLIKLGVINAFKVEIDFSKLEYKLYRLDINLNEDIKKQPIIEFLEKNPQLRSLYGSIGDAADIEIEIILEDVNQIHKILDTISQKFPNSIKEYKYHSSVKRHKHVTVPGSIHPK